MIKRLFFPLFLLIFCLLATPSFAQYSCPFSGPTQVAAWQPQRSTYAPYAPEGAQGSYYQAPAPAAYQQESQEQAYNSRSKSWSYADDAYNNQYYLLAEGAWGFNAENDLVTPDCQLTPLGPGIGNVGPCTQKTTMGEDALRYGGGLGVQVSEQIRVDVSYSQYSGFAFENDGGWSSDVGTLDEENVIDIQGGDITTQLIMIKGHYDIMRRWIPEGRLFMIPFVSAGVGYANNEIEDVRIDTDLADAFIFRGDETGNIAWTAGAGLSFDFGRMALDVGYRYLDMGEVKSSKVVYDTNFAGDFVVDELAGDLAVHEASGALRIRF